MLMSVKIKSYAYTLNLMSLFFIIYFELLNINFLHTKTKVSKLINTGTISMIIPDFHNVPAERAKCTITRPRTFRPRTFRPGHFGHGRFGHGKCQRWTFRP